MTLTEEINFSKNEINDIKNNQNKLLIYCKNKGDVELKSKNILKNKEIYANLKTTEMSLALNWYNLCKKRHRDREVLLKKVDADCNYIDTDSVNGYQQRFRTSTLVSKMQKQYFKELAIVIVIKAEIVATERRVVAQ